MMDCRARSASKAKGHLPGAMHSRGALWLAMQPQPNSSVSKESHTHHACSHATAG